MLKYKALEYMKLSKTKSWLKKKITNLQKKHILLLVIFFALSVTVYILIYSLVFDKKQNSSPKNDSISMAEKTESRYAASDQENLEKKDYDSYQYSKFNYVNEYIKGGDYKKSSQILDEVQANVPEDVLSTDIYMYRAEIAKKEDRKEDHKKYLETLISKLNQQQRKSEADYYKKKLEESGL